MILRPEQPKDYNAIAGVTYSAFLNWRKEDAHIHEPDMVSLARQSMYFDPDLSVVAEDGGEIAGHILLMPSDFMLSGKTVRGVILGPVSVLPELQKQGLGKKLIEYVHDAARQKGYDFSLLCGHPDYYPKFCYIQNAFSLSGTKIVSLKEENDTNGTKAKARPVREDDIDIIDKWQSDIRKNEPLALLFEKGIMGYHPFAKEKTAEVLEIGAKPVAYVKYKTYQRSKIDLILFGGEDIGAVMDYLIEKADGNPLEISQPYTLFKELLPVKNYEVTDEREAPDAFMILPFSEESAVNGYLKAVKKNAAKLGVICFPPYCDVG